MRTEIWREGIYPSLTIDIMEEGMKWEHRAIKYRKWLHRKWMGRDKDWDAISRQEKPKRLACVSCGCFGEFDCGHGIIDPDSGCSLYYDGECGCCKEINHILITTIDE